MPHAHARGLLADRPRRRGAPPPAGRHARRHGGIRVASRPTGHAPRRRARVQQPRAPYGRGGPGRGQVARLPRAVRPLELHERHARRPLHQHAQSPEPADRAGPPARRADTRRRCAELPRGRAQGPLELPLSPRPRGDHAGRLVRARRGRETRVRVSRGMAAPHGGRRPRRPRRGGAAPEAHVSGRGLHGAFLPLRGEVLHREGARARPARPRGGGEPRARARGGDEQRHGHPPALRTARLRRGAQPRGRRHRVLLLRAVASGPPPDDGASRAHLAVEADASAA